jgi:hypothetical protein
MLPCVLLTAMADVTIDFVTDVTYDTVKRLKMASNYPPYRHTNIQQHSRYYIPPSLSRGDPPRQGQRTRPAQYPAVGRSTLRDLSLLMTQPSTSNLSRVTRNPFLSWELDRAWAPECLDARRIESLAPAAREGVWNSRRRHAPCSEKTPRGVGLDCIYLREDHEHDYVQSLVSGTSNAKVSDNTEVDGSLLFLKKPRVPMQWSPAPQRCHGDPISEYPRGGDVFLPRDSVPRDSGYAVYAAGVAGHLGVPGRLLKEYRREWRHRRNGLLKSWSQTEYYDLAQHSRDTLYPKTPQGWKDAEVPARMFVPLPPVVTYRGSELIRGDPLHWTIFRTEWTALVFGRWVADIHFRGLLWQLPLKVRSWINQLGLSVLLQGSPLSLDEAHALLAVHDAVGWTQYEVVISDSKPEDGLVTISVAPIIYNRGKVTLEHLTGTSIPRNPIVVESRPSSAPALRSAPVPVMEAYDPRRPTMPTREDPSAALLDHDPYAPASSSIPPLSSWTLPDPYMPIPRGASQSSPYAATSHAPLGGARGMAGAVSVGSHDGEVPELGRLQLLLAASGHTQMLSRWPNAYGRIGAESVMAYIHYLDSECRRLATRARNLEDSQDRLREQLYDERRERVTWLSGALHEASQRMNEPARKRRRDDD